MSTQSITMSTGKKSMFVMPDGKNLMFTFILVSSLFLLWGICNGMIDVMDKHFQDELSLTKSQSAWVQFSHYLGYFLMAMPAGWLASRLGYKGGIITGLLMVSVGGFWFLPATHISAMAQTGAASSTTAFVGFLAGVCTIAAGLTFLETVANPYTTVLGPQRYSATRINLAQSCNGVGWLCGPILGEVFFYSTNEVGQSTGSETLYIPYVVVAGVVLALSVVFYFASVPDIKAEDDYKIDDKDYAEGKSAGPDRTVNRLQVYVLLLLNTMVLIGSIGMILWLILSIEAISQNLVGLAKMIPHPSSMKVTLDNCAAGGDLRSRGCVLRDRPRGAHTDGGADLASQHVVAPALLRGHFDAVLLRCRAGGHFQFSHQLHDRRRTCHSRASLQRVPQHCGPVARFRLVAKGYGRLDRRKDETRAR